MLYDPEEKHQEMNMQDPARKARRLKVFAEKWRRAISKARNVFRDKFESAAASLAMFL
jgi:hypothetical protein